MDIVTKLLGLLNTQKRICIYADGGYGKTTVMLEVYRSVLACPNHEDGKTLIPIYVPLADCAKDDFAIRRYIIAKYIGNDSLKKETEYYTEVEEKLFNSSASQYKYILLLDGINERYGEDFTMGEVSALARQPNVTVVVTTRNPETFSAEDPVWTMLELQPLRPNIVLQHCEQKGIGPPDIGLLNIPFFLSKYLEMGESNRKITTKFSFLQEYICWSIQKQIKSNRAAFVEYTDQAEIIVNEVLPEIAYRMVITNSMSVCTVDKDYAEIANNPDLSISLRKIFKYFVLPLGLAVNTSGKNYRFSHQIYRDYFAASFIAGSDCDSVAKKLASSLNKPCLDMLAEALGDTKRRIGYLNELNKHIAKIKSLRENAVLNQNLIYLYGIDRETLCDIDLSNRDLTKVDFSPFCRITNVNFGNSQISPFSLSLPSSFLPDLPQLYKSSVIVLSNINRSVLYSRTLLYIIDNTTGDMLFRRYNDPQYFIETICECSKETVCIICNDRIEILNVISFDVKTLNQLADCTLYQRNDAGLMLQALCWRSKLYITHLGGGQVSAFVIDLETQKLRTTILPIHGDCESFICNDCVYVYYPPRKGWERNLSNKNSKESMIYKLVIDDNLSELSIEKIDSPNEQNRILNEGLAILRKCKQSISCSYLRDGSLINLYQQKTPYAPRMSDNYYAFITGKRKDSIQIIDEFSAPVVSFNGITNEEIQELFQFHRFLGAYTKHAVHLLDVFGENTKVFHVGCEIKNIAACDTGVLVWGSKKLLLLNESGVAWEKHIYCRFLEVAKILNNKVYYFSKQAQLSTLFCFDVETKAIKAVDSGSSRQSNIKSFFTMHLWEHIRQKYLFDEEKMNTLANAYCMENVSEDTIYVYDVCLKESSMYCICQIGIDLPPLEIEPIVGLSASKIKLFSFRNNTQLAVDEAVKLVFPFPGAEYIAIRIIDENIVAVAKHSINIYSLEGKEIYSHCIDFGGWNPDMGIGYFENLFQIYTGDGRFVVVDLSKHTVTVANYLNHNARNASFSKIYWDDNIHAWINQYLSHNQEASFSKIVLNNDGKIIQGLYAVVPVSIYAQIRGNFKIFCVDDERYILQDSTKMYLLDRTGACIYEIRPYNHDLTRCDFTNVPGLGYYGDARILKQYGAIIQKDIPEYIELANFDPAWDAIEFDEINRYVIYDGESICVIDTQKGEAIYESEISNGYMICKANCQEVCIIRENGLELLNVQTLNTSFVPNSEDFILFSYLIYFLNGELYRSAVKSAEIKDGKLYLSCWEYEDAIYIFDFQTGQCTKEQNNTDTN